MDEIIFGITLVRVELQDEEINVRETGSVQLLFVLWIAIYRQENAVERYQLSDAGIMFY